MSVKLIKLLCRGMWLVNRGSYFKVAHVVKLKLDFMEWFFYHLVILIKLCKIRYLNLNKVLLFPRNQVICLKNWKVWRHPTNTKFNIFAEFCTRFLLSNVYKRVLGIFFILLRTWVINKNVKNKCAETRSFLFLQITQDLNKIKKSRTPVRGHW